MRLVDQAGDLLVDHARGVIGDLGAVAAEQRPPVAHPVSVLSEGHRAQLRAHPVLHDHGASDLGGLLKVVLGAGRDLAEHDLLGRSAPQGEREPVEQLWLGHQIPVFERPHHGDAEGRRTSRHDGHAVDRIDVLQPKADQGVPHLVAGHADLLLVGDEAALPLEPGHHPVDRFL